MMMAVVCFSGSGFGLQTIEENTTPFFGMQPPSTDGFAKPDYFGAGNISRFALIL